MTFQITRRGFIAGLATALLPLRLPGLFAADASRLPQLKVKPFELSQVRLLPGIFLDAAERNCRYLLKLDTDRLLHMFRITAGLSSSAEPLGGWEQPVNELRGHFMGHYLSACAMSSAAFRDESFTTRANLLVTELAKCQNAHGN